MGELLLPFAERCLSGTFLRRHKRFSVEVALEDGKIVWAHTNNSGAMLGLTRKGSPVLLSRSANPKRKLPYTLEAVACPGAKGWVGVNTLVPNRLILAAHARGLLPFSLGYEQVRAEAVFGTNRLDVHFSGKHRPDLWVECKNVTLVEDDVASFPDAQSLRGQKHLTTLMEIAGRKMRAAMFYLVQHPEGHCFAPADYIDEAYANLFAKALQCHVEMYVYRAHVTEIGITLGSAIPLSRDWTY